MIYDLKRVLPKLFIYKLIFILVVWFSTPKDRLYLTRLLVNLNEVAHHRQTVVICHKIRSHGAKEKKTYNSARLWNGMSERA